MDDVVAETLLVAWRRLDDVPPSPLPWLYGVARRVLANHRRGEQRRERLAGRVATAACADAVPTDTAVADDPVVLAALAALVPRDQEVLRLAAWEGLTAAEIAVALDCSENAAALRLSRARRKLRIALTARPDVRTQGVRTSSDG